MTETLNTPRPVWRLFVAALSLVLAVTLLAAAACGGDDEDATERTPAPTADGRDDNGDNGDNGDDGDPDDPFAELRQLSSEWARATVKVTYQFSNAFEDDTETGTWTFYNRPPDSRFDMITEGGVFTSITAGGTTYVCTSDNGDGICFSSPADADDDPLIPLFFDFTDPEFLDEITRDIEGLRTERFSRNIAGQDGRCFAISGTFEGVAGEGAWCFTSDGLLLLVEFSDEDGETFRMEVTEISRDVTDADFQPPFEVVDFETDFDFDFDEDFDFDFDDFDFDDLD